MSTGFIIQNSLVRNKIEQFVNELPGQLVPNKNLVKRLCVCVSVCVSVCLCVRDAFKKLKSEKRLKVEL